MLQQEELWAFHLARVIVWVPFLPLMAPADKGPDQDSGVDASSGVKRGDAKAEDQASQRSPFSVGTEHEALLASGSDWWGQPKAEEEGVVSTLRSTLTTDH